MTLVNKVRYDVDDSGSMDVKELGRLLFALLDKGQRVGKESPPSPV